jgi:hypothetical protein
MDTETQEQRLTREAELKQLLEPLGLQVEGSIVTVRLTGLSIDASALDHKHIVSGLIHMAHKQGVIDGKNQIAAEITHLFGES